MSTVRELSSSPGMLPMFARAGVGLVPGASRLPFVGGGGREIPDLTLVLPEVTIDRDRLAAYDRVCGFTLSDRLPATYPHMLAFPLQLALMTDPSFPFGAIGLVHILNRIVQHRPVQASEQLSLRVWSGPLEAHPRGQSFSLLTEARVGDELVWEEVSTNLRRGGGGDTGSREGGDGGGGARRGSESASAPEVPSSEGLPATATWQLPGDLGRRYASVSGDYNPIHVHPLSARLFGFPSAIAHGMWTKARCLAALEPRLPDAYCVEVAFRKPILLPGSVCFAQGPEAGGIRFGVRGVKAKRETAHLDGRLSSREAH